MSISQARMIALINAATDYRTAATDLINRVKKQIQEVHKGSVTPLQAIVDLEATASLNLLLSDPEGTPAILAVEHYHFQKFKRRNEAEAERARQSRLRAGAKPRQQTQNPFQTDQLSEFRKGTAPARLLQTTTIPLSRRAEIEAQAERDAQLMLAEESPQFPPNMPLDIQEADEGTRNQWLEDNNIAQPKKGIF